MTGKMIIPDIEKHNSLKKLIYIEKDIAVFLITNMER